MLIRYIGTTGARRINGERCIHGKQYEIPDPDAEYMLTLPKPAHFEPVGQSPEAVEPPAEVEE